MSTKKQFGIYGALSIAVLLMTALAMPSARLYFFRFYGGVHPLLVAIITIVIGGGLLRFLQGRGGFQIMASQTTGRGIAVSALMATCLGVAIILVDIFMPYPENTNVPMPQALVFYPAIGFVAEVVFHLVPLSVLVLLLSPLSKYIGNNRLTWIAIIVTSIAEPTFQVLLGSQVSVVAGVVTWLHVFAVAFLQLYVFRRFDFVSMFLFRLMYYGYWHIVWGVIRLEVLF